MESNSSHWIIKLGQSQFNFKSINYRLSNQLEIDFSFSHFFYYIIINLLQKLHQLLEHTTTTKVTTSFLDLFIKAPG